MLAECLSRVVFTEPRWTNALFCPTLIFTKSDVNGKKHKDAGNHTARWNCIMRPRLYNDHDSRSWFCFAGCSRRAGKSEHCVCTSSMIQVTYGKQMDQSINIFNVLESN